MTYVLGVDGGNTKTVAVIASAAGRIVGYGRGGCGDLTGAPTAHHALSEIAWAVRVALEMAGLTTRDVAQSHYSLAGADWPEDEAYLQRALAARTDARGPVVVSNDAFGALRAGSPDGTGAVIACGTAAAAAARNSAGETWHTGFWVEPLCGIELGRLALRAVYSSELGIEPPTSLTTAVLERFGKPGVAELVRGFEGRGSKAPRQRELSRLAPLVLDAAEAGDEVAERIVREHGERLALYGAVAAQRVGLDPASCHLVLTGGVFRHHGRRLKQAVLQGLGRAEGSEAATTGREPAIGALLLALEAFGVVVDDVVAREIDGSLPPVGLFAS